MKDVIRYGVVTNNIYGKVILKNALTGPAPSIRALSYISVGIFNKIPVVMSILYGIPTHIFTAITTTFAIVPLVKKGIANAYKPKCFWS